MEKEILNSMFENLLHIGNKTNFWNPKMKGYIYGSMNGIHVINLLKTEEKLEEVKKELKELHTSGKKILFVGTKLQARDAVEKIASESGHYYVIEKWVPGLLTNWKTIKRRIATYVQLAKDLSTGAFDMLTKKEKAGKILELEKLDRAYKGVKEMKKIPDVVFVVDGIYESQAIKEANILNLISFAVLNTNGDDTFVNNCIPANTNSVKSIDYVMNALKESVSGKVVATSENHQANREGVSKFRKIEDKKESHETLKNEKEKPVEKEVKVEVSVKDKPSVSENEKTESKKEVKVKEENKSTEKLEEKAEDVKVLETKKKTEVKTKVIKENEKKPTTKKAPTKVTTTKKIGTKKTEVK